MQPILRGIALLLTIGWALVGMVSSTRAEDQLRELADDANLQSEIEGYLSGLEATYGVAVVNLDDGRSAFVNSDTSFPTASMYKVLVMYRVFQAVERGELSMDDSVTIREADVAQGDGTGLSAGDSLTVGQALNSMITVSSNGAAWALTRAVGGWGTITSAAGELGMPSTYLNGADYWSTPNDMAHFFRLLANGSLVSQDASDQMIDLLFQQQINDRLPALLPGSAQVAHKSGELVGVRNDGGIVYGPGGSYVIVVMSQSGDPAEQIPAEATISQMVYERYGQ